MSQSWERDAEKVILSMMPPEARAAAVGKYVGRPREAKTQPVVGRNERGETPGWVVCCLDCEFAHDAHGVDPEEAVKSIAPTHEGSHRLIAKAVDYDDGWTRRGQPLAGIPATVGGHPLYHQ